MADTENRKIIEAVPLTAEAFAPYGDVVEVGGDYSDMNQGFGKRYSNLAEVDVGRDGGLPAIHLVTCIPEETPVPLRLMERHPLSSQLFMPLSGQTWIVLVAPAGDPPQPDAIKAFVASGNQGVNYHRGVWHHPLVVLGKECAFLEVQRLGPEVNCDEAQIATPMAVTIA